MKTFFAFACLSCFVINASAQRFRINTLVGVSNYQGDLQNKRFTLNQSHLAVGAGLSYELSDQFLLNGGFILGKISASDKYGSNFKRNLDFTSNITEGNLTAEYYFKNLYEHAFSPYIFGGLALYHFSPYTKDTAGNKYFLQPLSTEGQGFVANRKPYNLTQLALPFGGGVKLVLSDKIRVGVEVGLRKLFTDYLDDISTNYADGDLLLENRGPKAAELAYGGGELKNGATYPEAGSQRGGSKRKDWYYTAGFTASFAIGGGNRSAKSSGTGCPGKVF